MYLIQTDYCEGLITTEQLYLYTPIAAHEDEINPSASPKILHNDTNSIHTIAQ